MNHLIDLREFPKIDEMAGLPEVIKEIENDITEIELSGTYQPKEKKKLEMELQAVQNILAEFYN
jgi:hypothetical protein